MEPKHRPLNESVSSPGPSHIREWAEARPKAKDGAFQAVRVGFRGSELAALEIIDSFGQKSLLRFTGFTANVPVNAEAFRFKVPPGADVIEQ